MTDTDSRIVPVYRPTYFPPEETGFDDAHLMRLVRDTTWWLEPLAHDYHDIRGHGPIFYAIARNINWPDQNLAVHQDCPTPPVVLEIGTRLAISTLFFLYAMRETNGLLVSLEFDDGTRGDRENYVAKARERVEAAGLSQWWRLEAVDSNDYDPMPLGPLDVLFLDGAHDAEQVRREILKYAPRVRKNGMLLAHDYFSDAAPTEPPTKGSWVSEVSIPVDELVRNSPEWEMCVLPFCHGLCVARRVSGGPKV